MTVTKNVVLVGGGHAHVQVLERFAAKRAPACRLTVVSDDATTVYSGMVPGYVAGQYDLPDIQIDLIGLAKAAGADLVIARVASVDPANNRITLQDGSHLAYDLASFNIGSVVGGNEIPGVSDEALTVRPMGTFVRRILEVIGLAQSRPAGTPFRVTVVGGGAAGVELAFALHHRLARDTAISPELTLVEASRRILSGYPPSFLRQILRYAKVKRIDVRSGWRVRAVTSRFVIGDGEAQIPHDVVVWSAGVGSQPLFKSSKLSTDRLGFVRVVPTLQMEGHDNLFAVGDCASLVGHPLLPKAGVFAVRQAPILIRNLEAVLTGAPLRTYVPQSEFLTLLNLGDGRAIGTKWGRTVQGRWVMVLKDRIDRRFVRRFQIIGDG